MEPAPNEETASPLSQSRLRLPDLEHAKSAVLNSLPSAESRGSYEFAIQNFVCWYCSEPRLALNRIVVTRYRIQLEHLRLAPSTINQRLAAVRGLAYDDPSWFTSRWKDARQREDHWAIVDLVGKGGHVRTIPVPDWVKRRMDDWIKAFR